MVEQFFGHSYDDARRRFLAAADHRRAQVTSFTNPAGPGAEGETLTMDAALVGEADAPALLVLTSGTHGAEGFCGSGCQVALLQDDPLLEKAHAAGIAILLVHAVNPYGFSWGHRTNEDNVDLNRNFCDFSRARKQNRYYPALHPLLLPSAWPPGEDNERALRDFVEREGQQAYREGVMMGQFEYADGLFYGGTQPVWSNLRLRELLREHGAHRRRIAWIDYHTGLGPYGHAEKIFVQDAGPAYDRARAWWGADVVPVFDSDSSTVEIEGTLMRAMAEECPDVPEQTFLALEYGTLPLDDIFRALRGDRWLAMNPGADDRLRAELKAAHRAAFYPDRDDWRGAVIGQSRTALLQALYGLAGR